MEKLLRHGMVGGGIDGFIGDVHRKALNFDPRVRSVVGCFSIDAEANRKTGEIYHIEEDRVYPDYRTMAEKEAAREDGIDFVSIVTPNHTHYAIAKCFLQNGIHVVCEKPLCFTVEEAEELCALAKEKGLLFGVTYTYTGYTMSRVMREMIREGKIGKIAAVNAEYAQDWLLDELTKKDAATNPAIWRTDPKLSGISNSVGDIGTHIENYVHFVTGLRIRRLLATTNKYGHALELNSNIIVEYENGVNGAYWCCQVAAGRMNGLCVRVYGDKGALEWEQHYPDYLRYTPKGETPRMLSRGTSYLQEKAAGNSRIPSGHPEGLIIAVANIYRSFISAVLAQRAGEDPTQYDYPTVQDGCNGVKFVHAVVQSAANNSAWVELDEAR